MYKKSHFNIILNTTGYPLLKLKKTHCYSSVGIEISREFLVKFFNTNFNRQSFQELVSSH
jgi:hypothetical protein